MCDARFHPLTVPALAVLALLAFAPGAPAGTTYSYTSQPGDFIGQGQSATWTDAEGRWTISRNFDNGADFVFRATDLSSFWNLRFAAPNDVEITAGSYPNAKQFSVSPSDQPAPGLDVFGEGRSCSWLNADPGFPSSFDVSEVIYDWYGRPVRFAATFTQYCNNATAALMGSIDHTLGVTGPTTLTEDNLLVVLQNRLFEVTAAGEVVQVIPISVSDGTPPSQTESAKDVAIGPGGAIHVGHGFSSLEEGFLHTFNAATGGWRHDTLTGWTFSTPKGLAAVGDYVFLTGGLFPDGIVRFDTSDDYSATRFAEGLTYQDLDLGLDGRFYAQQQGNRKMIDVFNPETLALVETVTLDADVNGIAVGADGKIYGAISSSLKRFSAAGVTETTLDTGISGLFEVELTRDGRLAAGGSNVIVLSTIALASSTNFEVMENVESSISRSTYLTFIQLPPDPIFSDAGFESGTTDAWSDAPGLAAGLLEVNAGAASSGAFGLQVAIGGSCPFPALVELDAADSPISTDQAACATLSATDVQIVAPGASFTAGSSVALGNGVSVLADAPFVARLDSSFGSGFAFVQDDSPAGEDRYHARFQLNLDPATIVDGDRLDHFAGYAANGTELFRLSLKRATVPPENRLVLAARVNGGGSVATPGGEEIPLPTGWNEIEVDWKAGSGDGKLVVYLDGIFWGGLSNLTNDELSLESVRWGVVSGTVTSSTGHLLQDDFSSWR